MEESQPVFGREAEFTRIDDLAYAWGERHVVCIEAPAGTGKTVLLNGLQRRYQRGTYSRLPLLITSVVDLNAPSLHSSYSLSSQLARAINSGAFEPYFALLNNQTPDAQAARSTLRPNDLLSQTFLDCLNAIAANKRLILLVDSLDVLSKAQLRALWGLSERFENTLLVCAGRSSSGMEYWKQLVPASALHQIVLSGLSEEARAAYLQFALEQAQRSLSVEVLRQLLWFTRDDPVVLNLAVQYAEQAPFSIWLQRNASRRSATNRTISDAECKGFLRSLASTIIADDSLKSQLLVTLVRSAPLDVHLAAAVLDLPEHQIAATFAQVQQFAGVRLLANHWIAPHESFARIIRDYVLREWDPQGTQAQREYARLANALNARADQLAHKLFEREQQLHRANRATTVPFLIPNHFYPFRLLHDEYWWLRLQQLRYTLAADRDAGANLFHALFSEATQTYSMRVRQALIEQFQPYQQQLATEQHIRFERAMVQHLAETAQHQQARQLATAVLGNADLSPDMQVELLLYQAYSEVRLGFFDQAVANCERAIRLCQIYDLRHALVQALSARGWAYRNQGRHGEAMHTYLEAYQRSLSSQNWEQTIWVLLGISFINALQADRQAAYESNHSACELARRHRVYKALGAAYANRGELQVRFNEPVAALESFAAALEIFEEQDDHDWIAQVRAGCAFAYQVLEQFAQAEAELQWVLQFGPANLRTRVLYSQALLVWDQGRLQQAHEYLVLCRDLSREIGDQFHDYKSFADLIELAWEFGDFASWKQFLSELEQTYAQRTGGEARRLYGSCMRKIGDLAICAGEYDAALAAYEEGLPLIAENEIHQRYTIRSQMRQTNERIIARIPPKILSRLGRGLAMFWRSNATLIAKYPEALLTFHFWEQADVEAACEVGGARV